MFSNDEYHALRHGVGYVRRIDRGVVRLQGADRAAWLQGLVTNDVLAPAAGTRSYGAYLTPQGRMITDMLVVSTENALLLDVPAPLAASLASRLDRLVFAEDVQIDDASGEVAVVEIYGPGLSREMLTGLPGPPLAVADDRTLGVSAVAVYGPASAVSELVGSLASMRAAEVHLDTLDVLRVEAGVPAFLVDMTDDTIPLEAGIEDRAISFTKGCYVGQEIIVRVTQRGGGRVAKKLVGLLLEGTAVPPAGAAIRAGDRDVGRLTSCVTSPVLDRVIALGYVHRDFVAAGTAVEVRHGEQRIPAVVVSVPFVTTT